MLAAVDCYGGTCTPTPAYLAGYFGAMLLVYGVAAVLQVWICVRIARKAGFSPWLGVLGVVPVVSLVAVLVLAFKEWPVETELRELRGRLLTAQAIAGSSDPRLRSVASPALGGGFGDPRFSSAPTVPLYTGPATPPSPPPVGSWSPPQGPPPPGTPAPPQRW